MISGVPRFQMVTRHCQWQIYDNIMTRMPLCIFKYCIFLHIFAYLFCIFVHIRCISGAYQVHICKPNRYNIVQNVVQFVQYCNLVPIRTICTICTTTFTNIVQKVSQNVVQFIRKGFELIVQHVVQYRKEY